MEHSTIIALIVIAIICAAAIAWQHMDRAAEKMTVPDEYHGGPEEQAVRLTALVEERRERLEKIDAYNDACNMEPFCGEGKKP